MPIHALPPCLIFFLHVGLSAVGDIGFENNKALGLGMSAVGDIGSENNKALGLGISAVGDICIIRKNKF